MTKMIAQRARPRAAEVSKIFALPSLALALFLGAGPARAQEVNNTFNSMLSYFGMQFDKDSDYIDYRARPPLVVPPRNDLPPPKEAKQDPAWPKDPDVAAQNHGALDAHRPPSKMMAPNAKTELTQEELQRRRSGKTNDAAANDCQATPGMPDCPDKPWPQKLVESALSGVGKLRGFEALDGQQSEKAQPGPEPPRRYLTEPPVGYRAGSASAAATPPAPAGQ